MKKLQYIVIASIAALLAPCLASCGDSPEQPNEEAAVPASTQPESRKFSQASIKGQKEHLKQFDEKLKDLLGFQDLEVNEIGCYEGCEAFNSTEDLTVIRYAFPRDYPDIYATFTAAWGAVQESVLDPDLRIEFDNNILPTDCTGSTNPPPCSSMPFCAIDRCGRKPLSGTSCSAC